MFYIDITYNSLLQDLYYTQNITKIYLTKSIYCELCQLSSNDLRMIYQVIHESQNCLINFKVHRIAYLTNLNTIKRIPLIDKYLNGSGDISENYQVFGINQQRFDYPENCEYLTHGCSLVNINLEFYNIPVEIINLFQYFPNILTKKGSIYVFQILYLKYFLDYTFLTMWPEDYIFSSIQELANVLGIEIEEYNSQFNFDIPENLNDGLLENLDNV